jgi:uncharacterized protein (TIGR03435 family)
MFLACGAGWGQPPEAGPQFEAASVKPSPPPPGSSGRVMPVYGRPRMPDPSLFICDYCTLSDLVLGAYRIQPYQLVAPGWMDSELFAVSARVPAGTTAEQLRLMQQNLLADRFKLTCHREAKDMTRFELVVAKGGPKLKASVGELTPGDGRPAGGTVSPQGLVTMGHSDMSMAELATILSRQVHAPVADATGLQGKFDFTLSWVMDRGAPFAPPPDDDAGPTIFNALQSQLGLRLEQKKGPVDRLVIDHAEKVPTGN